jgi:predicted ATPase
MKNFMVISCVRSSYIDDGGLKEWLSLLEENRIERIELSSFSIEETGRFISETLELKSEETSSLTMAVYNKTRGNIFSTIHALEELHRKNIIHFSVIAFQWEWNVTAVELLQSQLSDDVLMAVMTKSKASH